MRRRFLYLCLLIVLGSIIPIHCTIQSSKPACFQGLETQYGTFYCTQAHEHRSPHINGNGVIWDRSIGGVD